MKIRIQKHLSEQGILSRRKTEEYLQKGWILVNEKVVTKLGTTIDPKKDAISFLDNIEVVKKNYHYLLFNKPRGIITNCPQKKGEREIVDLLPRKYKHVSAIGRLDKDSEGLIILTNDGVLANKLLNADPPHAREYEVTLDKLISLEDIRELENGIYLFGKKTLPLKIVPLEPGKIRITMIEGKNRQIRRMLLSKGYGVKRLIRTRFAKFRLGHLEPGTYIKIQPRILKSFYK